MQYNFDEEIQREGTNAYKVDLLEKLFGSTDLIPMWVADMDFATPPFIINAVQARLNNKILGYTVPPQSYFEAICKWNKRRYDFDVSPEEVNQIPGVVCGINLAVQAFTEKGDNVMIMQPVYHPFRLVPQAIGRNIIDCPLVEKDGRFRMDYDIMDQLLPQCKALVLCNPHNPGGYTWSVEELQKVASLCRKHNVVVIDDEIHADLTYKPYKHTPFLSVSDDAKEVGVTLQAPTKAFNCPGIITSHAIVKNPKLRERFFGFVEAADMELLSTFSYATTEACYSDEGEEWLNQCLAYIKSNIDHLCKYCAENMPLIKPLCPEASYLVFLDCRQLGFENQDLLNEFIIGKAHLALNPGNVYGPNGKGYMRMNLGCTRATLDKALCQLKSAYDKLSR